MLAQIRLYQGFTAIARGDLGRAAAMFEDVIAMGGGRPSSEVLAYAFDGLAGVALYKATTLAPPRCSASATLCGCGPRIRSGRTCAR